MSNPPGPDHDATPPATDNPEPPTEESEPVTEALEAVAEPAAPQEPASDDAEFGSDTPTEVLTSPTAPTQPRLAPGFDPNDMAHIQTPPEAATAEIPVPAPPADQSEFEQPTQRRYTAPGFDAGATEQFHIVPDAPTEVISMPKKRQVVAGPPKAPPPQPPQPAQEPPKEKRRRSWRWVLVLVLVVAVLAAAAIIGALWLTGKATPRISQQDRVRSTIENFDVAVQKGDLATLRSITCGAMADSYVNYDEKAWAETHARVAAAKQYPVVASIDEVVVNGDYAEANVTTYMAYAPQTKSTRSFDLQYRDGQWKVCQAPGGPGG